ncbi:hypothetical protein OTSUT76_1351 [Orientia tsutsugamushi str. UT76]|uniref:Transposase n=1 Tax=Orientia tsutsugamushi TaxID=784 RepID=A0A2U3R9X0_ORITS|nr:hypothetical protein OTSUT76_1351 [Orientia tsutsugamushi str. UT76]SPR10015.1 transposase [Orientia tsutsugamushi]
MKRRRTKTYEQELKYIWDNKAVEDYKLERAKAEGIKLGEAKGKAEAKKDFAIKLLKSELSVETIAEYMDKKLYKKLQTNKLFY